MKVKILLLIVLVSLFNCTKKYECAKDISHLEYLNISGKVKEMQVTFYADELSNGVYIPKNKINQIAFNLEDLYTYPNLTFNVLKLEYVPDGRILKQLLISYLGNPIEYHYTFDDGGNVSKVSTKGDYTGNEEIQFLYDKNGNISKITTKSGKDVVIEDFKFDENNLLLRSEKFINGRQIQINSYSYVFSKNKILCALTNGGKTKVNFDIIHQDYNTISFGNDNYKVKFKGVLLISEEEYENNQLKQSTKNSFKDNLLLSKEITSRYATDDYINYTLTYSNGHISGIEAKRKDEKNNYIVNYDFDSRKNWSKITINDDSAFKQYKYYEDKIKNFDENHYYTDEISYRMYRIDKAMLESNLKLLQLNLNQRRCERNLIY